MFENKNFHFKEKIRFIALLKSCTFLVTTIGYLSDVMYIWIL